MTRGKRVLTVLGCVMGAVLLASASTIGCSVTRPDATVRVGRHFELGDVSSEESIQTGLAAKLPMGTPEQAIYEFLTKSGIGKDRLSSYFPIDKDRTVVCRIEYDPDTLGLAKESYGIVFRLDEQHTLRAIEVKKWLTGL